MLKTTGIWNVISAIPYLLLAYDHTRFCLTVCDGQLRLSPINWSFLKVQMTVNTGMEDSKVKALMRCDRWLDYTDNCEEIAFLWPVCEMLTRSQRNSLHKNDLTLTMPNILNGIIHLTFLALSITIFRDIKMKSWSLSANNSERGQIARVCRLAWLYTGGKCFDRKRV